MNRLSRQEQIRSFQYLFPIAIVLSLLLYGIFGSKDMECGLISGDCHIYLADDTHVA